MERDVRVRVAMRNALAQTARRLNNARRADGIPPSGLGRTRRDPKRPADHTRSALLKTRDTLEYQDSAVVDTVGYPVVISDTVRDVVKVSAPAIYERFRRLPGCEHMAKQDAIAGLIATLKRYRPSSVLEIGAGIGTLTWTLTEWAPPGCLLTSVEDNAFCLEQLQRNLGERQDRVRVVGSIDELGEDSFDLVVVDGGRSDWLACVAKSHLAGSGVAFVEGFRDKHRAELRGVGRNVSEFTVRSSRWTTRPDDKKGWAGAYSIVKFEPSFRDRLRSTWHRQVADRLVSVRRRLHSAVRGSTTLLS